MAGNFAIIVILLSFFFFSSRRRHTRSDRDWSSDVCSSDLKIDPSFKLNSAPILRSTPLEDLLQFLPILLEDLFRRRLFSLFAWPLNLRGRICHRRFFAEIVEVCPVEPDEERKRPDEQGNKDEEQGGSKPSTLFLSSFLRHDAETKRKALVIRLVLEVMRRVDDADRAALRAHDHGLRRRASREKVNASQVVPVGHAGGGERHVASRQFLD